ncbi:MAG TPA: amino acid adenylation domain-containing protein, partial [Blastocatellia bacterium]|nr:amino acid adenylation domain-containing protein [Blastocatellia bacterium]
MSNLDLNVYSTAEPGPCAEPGPWRLINILRQRALHDGDRLAFTFLADGETERVDLTYAELDRRSRAIGASLQRAGAAGQCVLLLYPHGLEFITAFLGCLYAGAIAVPAYPPRLNRSQLRLQKIIEDTRAVMALTAKTALGRVERIFSGAPYARNLSWSATDETDGELAESWQEPAVNSETIAMIQYTSGSTSTPKGVVISHDNLISNQLMIRQAFRQTESSVIVGWLPLYHDMGLIGNVLQPLFLGARCILMPPTAFLQKPFRWLRAISDYRATTSGGPNFAYDLCARQISREESAQLDLSGWTTAFNGSEPIFPETMERFAAAFAGCGFRREAFYPCYGLAEATLLVSAGANGVQPESEERAGPVEGPQGRRARVGCGSALPNERVVIVDPETMIQCPAEQTGEIWVSGPNVARGYWNREPETERTFKAHLKETGDGPFLRTGDLGYLKDGELFVTGRIKDLIVIRGRNHYPQDLELTVQQSHPALESGSCAAFSIERADEERLVIVKESGRGQQDPNSLIDLIREAVTREHEIPASAVVLVERGRIPRTTSGKVQRYQCRNEYLAGRLAVVAAWHEGSEAEVAPAEKLSPGRLPTLDDLAIEAVKPALSSFLATKLRRSIERIDLNRSLVGQGVDSLTAVELLHYVESRFGTSIQLESLFEDVSIERLARQIVEQLRGAASPSKPAFEPVPPGITEHPVSYGQRSLWFLHQLAPQSGAYNVSSAVRIRSTLNTGALGRALQQLVDRHDPLRTTFLSREGEPRQKVHERQELSLTLVEASSWSDDLVGEYLAEEAHRPFDLERGPLFRASLLTRSPEDHVFLIVAHHLTVDLWSMEILIHELGLLYRAQLDCAPVPPLDPLPIRYLNYVYWQAALLRSPAGERLWSYWQTQLAGDLKMLDLPTDRPRPSLQTFRGDSRPLGLSPDLTRSLKSLGQQRGASLYMALQAVFHVLLHRYTDQAEILIGSPMAGRNAPELAPLIGYFVNPVVLRADLSGHPCFSLLLERIRRLTVAAMAHQDYPFALLVERLQLAPDPSRSPLFQVMFALQKAPSLGERDLASQSLIEGVPLNFGEFTAEPIALRRRASRFDLSLFLVETDDGLKGTIEYNADLFDEWRIERMARHFQTLAAAVLADPERPIREIELLNESERRQILIEWNRTEREAPLEFLAHELIAEQARLRPESIAVICNDERLSYGALESRANRLANHLGGLGAGPDCVVGLYLERSTEILIGLLGILKAGAAYLPLETGQPAERLGIVLEDSGAGLVITKQDLAADLPIDRSRMVLLDTDRSRIAACGREAPKTTASPENLAYVIYTSGSTGKPKGVMVRHRGLVNYAHDLCRQLGETKGADPSGWQFAVVSTIAADLGNTCIYPSLVSGGGLHLLSYEEATDGVRFGEYLKRNPIDVLKIVPSHYHALLKARAGKMKMWPAKVLVFGGEVLSRELVEMIKSEGAECVVINHYGPTETTIGSLTRRFDEKEEGRQGSVTVPIGRPISNTESYLLDRHSNPVPVGARGELHLAGAGLARGYLGRPELTAERFIPNQFSRRGGERMYRTGDLARYLPDGNIEFIGREDAQVKIRGYRVELGEIEAALNEHPAVRQSVVVARRDEGGGPCLLGYVVNGAEVTAAELKRHLRERLPGYMVPEAIVMLNEMPVTANGKIDRRR